MSTAAADERRKTVCVTGGSGYIASGLIKFLLEKGYAVNTTVRNPGPISLCSHPFLNLSIFLGLFRKD